MLQSPDTLWNVSPKNGLPDGSSSTMGKGFLWSIEFYFAIIFTKGDYNIAGEQPLDQIIMCGQNMY